MNEPNPESLVGTFAPPPSASPPPAVGTLTDILESVPLHSPRTVEDLFALGDRTTGFVSLPRVVSAHCDHEACGGVRRHVREEEPTTFVLVHKEVFYTFVAYTCANCLSSKKVFGLKSEWNGRVGPRGLCTKIYQEPAFGAPIPNRVFGIIGEANRGYLLQARRAISRGLGIGAYAYYRRIVENTKFDLVASVLDVATRTNAPPAQLELLKKAQKERQFSKAMEMLSDVSAVPPVLLIRGHNPLTLLHDALSEGIHQLDDKDCLERAQEAEAVLFELARSMQTALAERKEVESAVSSILKRKSSN